jgi:hypothetical protein
MSLNSICLRTVLAKKEAIQAVLDDARGEASHSSSGVADLINSLAEALKVIESAFRSEIAAAKAGGVPDDGVTAICINYLVLLRQIHEHLRHLPGTRDTEYPTELIRPAEAILKSKLTQTYGLVIRAQTKYMYEVMAYTDFVANIVSSVCNPLPSGVPDPNLPKLLILLPLPAAEHKNMRLHCTMLGHEIGHVIDLIETKTSPGLVASLQFDKSGVEEMVKQAQQQAAVPSYLLASRIKGKAQERATHWLSEIVADLIAARTLGPAYVAALIEFWFPLGFSKNSWGEQHPAWEMRISFIVKALKRMGYDEAMESPFGPLLSDAESISMGYTPPPTGSIERLAYDAMMALEGTILDAVQQVIPDAEAFSYMRYEAEVQPLRLSLSQGIPAGQIVDTAAREVSPAAIPAIMNAGWAVYLDQSDAVGGLMGVAQDDLGWPPVVDQKINALIGKSIEASEFLRQWEPDE